MKKGIKILVTLLAFIAVPCVAAFGIAALWNGILPSVCGFSAITYCQALGLFILGQLLSSGFIIALFFGFGSLHALIHGRGGDWGRHWHNMSDEERLEFIRRRREHFGFRQQTDREDNYTANSAENAKGE